jgi:hypothetical protein
MGAPFFAMAGVHWLALVSLYVGMSLVLLATGLYLKRGLEQIRGREPQDAPDAAREAAPPDPAPDSRKKP